MKDRFSDQPDLYATFRPAYPPEMIAFILSLVKDRYACWDAGTGNGQLLQKIAPSFQYACGTDISAEQLKCAPELQNVEYKVCPAHQDPSWPYKFNLITVAQALHWFKFNGFYEMVNRYLTSDGVLVVAGYGLMRIDDQLNELIGEMYQQTLGPWWDPERRYVEDEYRSIPFPFEELQCPSFTIRTQWQRQHLEGYIRTWSAYKLYIKAGNPDPVPLWMKKISAVWPEQEIREVQFPVFIRAGHSPSQRR